MTGDTSLAYLGDKDLQSLEQPSDDDLREALTCVRKGAYGAIRLVRNQPEESGRCPIFVFYPWDDGLVFTRIENMDSGNWSLDRGIPSLGFVEDDDYWGAGVGLPRRLFCDPELALSALIYFRDHGERMPSQKWINYRSFSEIEPDLPDLFDV